jgi:hypothetical protein
MQSKNKSSKKKSKKDAPDGDSEDTAVDGDDEDKPSKKSKVSTGKKKKQIGAGEPDDDTEKPRIKIKVVGSDKSSKMKKTGSAAKSKAAAAVAPTKSGKRSRAEAFDGDDGEESANSDKNEPGSHDVPAPPAKKKSKKDSKSSTVATKQHHPSNGAKKGSSKKKKASSPPLSVAIVAPDSVWLDATPWKVEREALNGTFGAARDFFIKHGPWRLPSGLEDLFPEIALSTLTKINRYARRGEQSPRVDIRWHLKLGLTHFPLPRAFGFRSISHNAHSKDRYRVFAAAVSDSDAPGYSEIVDNPMDFGRMKEKVEEGLYGDGSAAAAALYGDFLLVFDNCRLYNDDDSDVTAEAARILALVPEAYVSSCAAAQKKAKL